MLDEAVFYTIHGIYGVMLRRLSSFFFFGMEECSKAHFMLSFPCEGKVGQRSATGIRSTGARVTLTTNACINASRCSRATVAAIQATLHMPVGESCAAMEMVQSTIFNISSGVLWFNVHITHANVSTVAQVGVC